MNETIHESIESYKARWEMASFEELAAENSRLHKAGKTDSPQRAIIRELVLAKIDKTDYITDTQHKMKGS